MRPLALAALAALVFSVPALAQPTFGVKAGLNVTSFSGDDAEGSEARLGFVGGLTATVPFTPTVGLQIEALYSQAGEEYLNSADLVEETRIDYLQIPAAVRLGLPVSPTLDAGVSLGGYVGVPLRGEVEVDGTFENDLDLNTDFGGLIGVDVGSGPFFVDARYSFGLTNAIERDPGFVDSEGFVILDPDKKNQIVSLTFGYRFGGGYNRY